MKKILNKYMWGLGLITLFSCNGFLEEKPRKSLLVPEKAEEVRAILDNYNYLTLSPLLGFMLSDEWETTSQDWESFDPWQQNSYLWNETIFDPQERSSDYQTLHGQMFYANTCLDLLGNLEESKSVQISQMKGEALVIRSKVLFDLALLFLPGPNSSLTDQIKIPVNLTSDVNTPLQMIGVSELFVLIKRDLEMAFSILPEESDFKTRPDKRVAMGLLARIYLYEQNWEKALEAANYVIQYGDGLLNYLDLDPTKSYPFSVFNQETLFFQQMQTSIIPLRPTTSLKEELYESYLENDLRKALFFKMSPTQGALFKGSYTGGFRLFSGIGLSEMYLIAAEAGIRMGRQEEGLQRLNELGENRYSDFNPWQNLSQQEAIGLVMKERNRELVFRCLRWMDMKRTKYLDPSFTTEREINGEIYTLKNEEQFILKLPPYEKELVNR
ncbi:RagB/SusD family nutrient uptake outer membrane protein [Algoriphagus sp. CAU 1675]|uniref:RagB/SusD family nutrient uptake outer membrane protein n=1 Tax=Algoriphagus sp. CAU 1675 TaxID=3032597 RepID=UPI0023DC8475|nr:RagB/SusD family nutrient uptake outer membrane protein [Algoriphagus sp. CAU 1675]MDF2159381.1 RagB/SusD family nutrient uptake outer membrane protein [Algoriphagus sp. CAU 1675]